jgi:CRISPR-associated protein Csb2
VRRSGARAVAVDTRPSNPTSDSAFPDTTTADAFRDRFGGAANRDAPLTVEFRSLKSIYKPIRFFPGAERTGRYRVPEYLRQFTKTHAIITFSEPVVGPVVIGAGRYVGLGLMSGFDQ